MASRTIPFLDKEPRLDAVLGVGDPSTAKLHMQLAQMRRDHGLISGRELAKLECQMGDLAAKATTIYNPFTGEVRRVYLRKP